MTDEKAPEPTTRTLYHPTIPGRTEEVPVKDVERWAASGWRKTPLK